MIENLNPLKIGLELNVSSILQMIPMIELSIRDPLHIYLNLDIKDQLVFIPPYNLQI